MGIYAIMLPSSGFSVAHYVNFVQFKQIFSKTTNQNSFIFGFGETPGDLVSSNKIALKYTCDLKEQTSLNTFRLLTILYTDFDEMLFVYVSIKVRFLKFVQIKVLWSISIKLC